MNGVTCWQKAVGIEKVGLYIPGGTAPRTWVPILLRNKYNVLDVLREHIHQLQIMRRMIERDDAEGLTAAMQRANAIQKILP